MNNEIPAFLKLSIDGYRSISQKPASKPLHVRRERTKAHKSDVIAGSAHSLSEDQLANSLSAIAITSASSALSGGTLGPADDHALLTLWQSHWRALQESCAQAPTSEQTELAMELLAAHRQPHRIHHGLGHLVEGLRLWADWQEHAPNAAELAIAIWFHDAVYDTARHDSEARSARWALDSLTGAGIPFEAVRRIRDMVIATRPNESPANDDARLMVDIDLAVLGTSPGRYDRYEADLQAEHPQIAEFIYRRKRVDTLKALLTRPRIFHTDVARQRFESQARENITRTIARLQDTRSIA